MHPLLEEGSRCHLQANLLTSGMKDAGRPQKEHTCWTVVSTPEWAEQALESDAEKEYVPNIAQGNDSPDSVSKYALTLLQDFQAILSKAGYGELPQPVFVAAQRWGAAFKADVLEEGCLVDEGMGLLACGDFCIESSARGAMSSGLSAARAVQKLSNIQ